MKSLIYDILNVSNYHTNYLNTLDRYKSYTRNSIFVRYYRINKKLSRYDNVHNASETRYNSGLIYDVFDYTPLKKISAIDNNYENNTNTGGFSFNGSTQVLIYTIENPNINDLLTLPYKPNNSNEIFRIKDINLNLNSNVDFSNLTLEYSNMEISEINKLNINEKFYFLITHDKYIRSESYRKLVEIISLIRTFLNDLLFDENREIYINLNKDKNTIIYEFIKENTRLITDVKIPFGFELHNDSDYTEIETDYENFIKLKNEFNTIVDEKLELNY